MNGILSIRGVSRTFRVDAGRHGRAASHRPRGRRERLHHDPRPVGLRQVDAAAHRRRARPADRRRGAARRPAHRRRRRRPRHGVPELHAVPVADSARERLLRPARARRGRARSSSRPRSRSCNASGCVGFEHHYPKQLSGGMQQRTALARALANDPRMLLMDEPFGALDHQTRELMQELLLGIWEAERKTVLFVTHDIDEAVFMGIARRRDERAAGAHQARQVVVPFGHPRHYSLKTTPEFARAEGRAHRRVACRGAGVCCALTCESAVTAAAPATWPPAAPPCCVELGG